MSKKNEAMSLTLNQEKTYDQLTKLSKTFPVIVIQGDKESGKNTVISKFLNDHNHLYITLDICYISLQDGNPLQPGNFYKHLLNLSQEINRNSSDTSRWIYIRHWDKIREVMEDYGTDYRYFPRYALSRFSEELIVNNHHLIISTENNLYLDNNNYWVIKHEIRSDDIYFLMSNSGMDDEQISNLLPTIRRARLGQVKQILSFATAFPKEEWIEKFKDGAVKICGSNLDPEETVTETVSDVNLIGMDNIIEEIEKAIIKPMNFDSDQIPLKKGIVLAGPPGTGKTSIGRWLAYKIRGKLYLVDGTAGVDGTNLLANVSDNLDRAYKNAPAVVFVDDVDLLFDHSDTYRAFLTLLDGLENKNRGGVCVIVTCMDITKIPSSLIRGGRLELCLETKLPEDETRKKIIQIGFDRMFILLNQLKEEKKINVDVSSLRDQLTHKTLSWIVSVTSGWNCADIQRCLDDVLRNIISNDSNISQTLKEMIRIVVDKIRHQYHLVRRPEEKIDSSTIYN